MSKTFFLGTSRLTSLLQKEWQSGEKWGSHQGNQKKYTNGLEKIDLLLLFFMNIDGGYYMESNHKSYSQKNVNYSCISSSVYVQWLSEFAQSVPASLLLSIPQLFYEQLPSSSSTFPLSLISFFVVSPKMIISRQYQIDPH